MAVNRYRIVLLHLQLEALVPIEMQRHMYQRCVMVMSKRMRIALPSSLAGWLFHMHMHAAGSLSVRL